MIDYEKVLSNRVKNIKPSGIRRFFDIASTMEGVISLGVGEPDFSTPWAIRKAAIKVLERKQVVYGPNLGIAPLRQAIADKLKKTHGVEYDPDNQIIGQIVEEDVGFGPENMGVATKEIWERVEEQPLQLKTGSR